MSSFSTGTDHSAGSVPRCEGSRDGGEIPSPLVGRLADSGPRPAQPGGGGPGECDRTLQRAKALHINASRSRREMKTQNLTKNK